jgi:hypothetical protein
VKMKARVNITVDLDNCPRCGASHPQILFQNLANPEIPYGVDNEEETGARYDIYAFCSQTNQPVLASQAMLDITDEEMSVEDLESLVDEAEKQERAANEALGEVEDGTNR